MKRESPTAVVESRIQELQVQYDGHVAGIRSSLSSLGTQLKPSNLLQSGVKSITRSKGIGSAILLPVLGICAGLFAKKILVNKSKNLFKKIAGTGLQFLITSVFGRRLAKRKRMTDH